MPVTNITLGTEVEYGDYPSYTWYIDPASNQLRGMCDGFDAVKQAVEIILSIERFKYQIYSPNVGIETEGLIGADAGFVESELRRRINDALSVESRVTGTRDFKFRQDDGGSIIFAEFTVDTVYGEMSGAVGMGEA